MKKNKKRWPRDKIYKNGQKLYLRKKRYWTYKTKTTMATVKLFKQSLETMSKELQESRKMLTHQIEKINKTWKSFFKILK